MASSSRSGLIEGVEASSMIHSASAQGGAGLRHALRCDAALVRFEAVEARHDRQGWHCQGEAGAPSVSAWGPSAFVSSTDRAS